jgi:hypothetical protein
MKRKLGRTRKSGWVDRRTRSHLEVWSFLGPSPEFPPKLLHFSSQNAFQKEQGNFTQGRSISEGWPMEHKDNQQVLRKETIPRKSIAAQQLRQIVVICTLLEARKKETRENIREPTVCNHDKTQRPVFPSQSQHQLISTGACQSFPAPFDWFSFTPKTCCFQQPENISIEELAAADDDASSPSHALAVTVSAFSQILTCHPVLRSLHWAHSPSTTSLSARNRDW